MYKITVKIEDLQGLTPATTLVLQDGAGLTAERLFVDHFDPHFPLLKSQQDTGRIRLIIEGKLNG